jgi:hypothetical protein
MPRSFQPFGGKTAFGAERFNLRSRITLGLNVNVSRFPALVFSALSAPLREK